MSERRPMHRHPAFRDGMRQMSPQILGMVAWGLMTGVAMAKSGLSLPEAMAMALLVYAGSSQLAALPLLAAGAPAWVVLATAFCVNLRFVVFSLHLRQYLMHLPLLRRLFAGYLTADMSYVLFTQRFPQPATDAEGQQAQDAFLAGANAILWVSWMVPSLLGTVLAHSIPTAWGLGFAGILALVGLLCALATHWLRLMAVAVASATAVAAYALPLKLNIVVAIAVAVAICLMLERWPKVRKGGP
jgi:predicted branched-subunit amino acid permease